MKVKYVRYSSVGQNAERQLLDKADFDKIYSRIYIYIYIYEKINKQTS